MHSKMMTVEVLVWLWLQLASNGFRAGVDQLDGHGVNQLLHSARTDLKWSWLPRAPRGDDLMCRTNGSHSAWQPACHPATLPSSAVQRRFLLLMFEVSAFTYCDFWDRDENDINSADARQYNGHLADELRSRWSHVCDTMNSKSETRETCRRVMGTVTSPVMGGNATLLYYISRLTHPDGRKLVFVTFRGTRMLHCQDWNVDISDPCPREVAASSLEFVDARAAERGECSDIEDDTGFRLLGSMTAAYKNFIRRKVQEDILAEVRAAGSAGAVVEVVLQGHSLGGGLAQICAFDLLHSGILEAEDLKGRIRLIVVAFKAPRVFGRTAARSTMLKLKKLSDDAADASGTRKGFMAGFNLGLDWRGVIVWNPADPITVQNSLDLINKLEEAGFRETIVESNLLGDKQGFQNMVCPSTGPELIKIVSKAKQDVGRNMFDQTGRALSTCVRMPSKFDIELAWPQYFYMAQPLVQVYEADSYVKLLGSLAYHASFRELSTRKYMYRAIADHFHDFSGKWGFLGNRCPGARPTCGCPFRYDTEPIVVIFRRYKNWNTYCSFGSDQPPAAKERDSEAARDNLSGGGIECKARRDEAQRFAIWGSCTSGSSMAQVMISAIVEEDDFTLLPCHVSAADAQVVCSKRSTHGLFGLDLISTGLKRKIQFRLFKSSTEDLAPKSTKSASLSNYCLVKGNGLVCDLAGEPGFESESIEFRGQVQELPDRRMYTEKISANGEKLLGKLQQARPSALANP